MALTNYRRGADKERRIVNKFRKAGAIALRSAGSHSIIDVVTIDKQNKIILLIQSKLGYLSKPEKERIRKEGEQLNGDYRVVFELWD